MRTIFLLLISMLLPVSAMADSFSQQVNKWRGTNSAILLQKWGQPDIKEKLSNGDSLFIYYIPAYQKMPPEYGAPVGVNNSGPHVVIVNMPRPAQNTGDKTLRCTAIFTVGKNNMIVGTKASGTFCKSMP